MRNRVLKTIKNYGLLSRGDRCILAVSGGADSMALLHILNSLKEELGIELRTVHVHHGLRGAEADRDAGWVQESCDKLGIPCEIRYVDVKRYVRETGDSVEEAARILRYRELFDAAAQWDAKIAVAHNLGDNAETILMQMARGSGLKGLGGIDKKNGPIIRPLLEVKRCEIEEYLKGLGCSWVTDSTNLDDEYTRNRVRHKILPELEAGVNSSAAEHIVAAGDLISQAYDYIRMNAEKLIGEHADMHEATDTSQENVDSIRNCHLTVRSCRFPVDVLRAQPQILRSTVIMLLLGKICGTRKDISAVHIGDVVSLIDKENGKYIMLPYGLRARREYGDIVIERCDSAAGTAACAGSAPDQSGGSQDLRLHFKTRIFAYSGEEVPAGEYTKWFDYDKINSLVNFRHRAPGDYIVLGKTGRKSVAAYMTDRKIPGGRRDKIPLVADGAHILWIVGYRISEAYKVTESTVNVLEVTYCENPGRQTWPLGQIKGESYG